jgi:nicotinamide-nucleotide amidase
MTNAAVLSIGTELTRGELINSNAAWIAEQLTELGFDVFEHVSVDDDKTRIAAHIKRLAEHASVVISTGGLGPTTDDLTTLAVAEALNVPLERDRASLERIRYFFSAFGRTMSPSNEKQADFPQGADVLANELGTAPGFGITFGACTFYFLPGVPREMKHLFSDRVLPRIGDKAERQTHQVHLRTFGMPEAQVGELLSGVEQQHPGVTIGYRASFPEIEVKVHARSNDERTAQAKAERAVEVVKQRLGEVVFGDRDTTYAAAVGRVLRDRGVTLGVAESCTGGMVGSMLTSVPGSSDYLLFDAVVYSNGAKTSMLGVSEDLLRAYGAVSEESVCAMLDGVMRLSKADVGVAVTGIAGPGGGSDEKPVGTVWLAVGNAGGQRFARSFRLGGDRERIRTLSAYMALRAVMRLALGRQPWTP